jgi:hypothetical protein
MFFLSQLKKLLGYYLQRDHDRFLPRNFQFITHNHPITGSDIMCVVEKYIFFPVALQSLKDLGRFTYRRFLELFRHMLGLLGRVISSSQGLYLHRTKHRKTRTNIHALSGIRTHDPSNQPAKTHASDRTATVTGIRRPYNNLISTTHTSVLGVVLLYLGLYIY